MRRRILDGDTVVLDGLIYWLDGQDEIAEGIRNQYYGTQIFPDRWLEANLINRVGGSFTHFNSEQRADISKETRSKFYTFNKQGNGAFIIENQALNNVKTIEIVCSKPSTVMPQVGKNLSLYYPHVTFVYPGGSQGLANRRFRTDVNTTYHIIATIDDNGVRYVSVNGYEETDTTTLSVEEMVNNVTEILTGSVGDFFYLGAIRLYNRPLNQKEIKKNLNYEKGIGRIE